VTSVTTPIASAPGAAERRDGRLERRCLDVREHEPHALARKPLGDRAADAARAAP
jgi:hypothetical protein